MNILITAFNTILYQPLLNILVLLYTYLGDFGIAVIVLTLIIKLLLYPSSLKSLKSQRALTELQPEIKKVQQQYKDDKTGQAKAMMELYKRKKISPFSGCLPLLFQLPILIALYRVFWGGLDSNQMAFLYSWVSAPGAVNTTFLGFLNLAQPNGVMAVLAGISQFIFSKLTMKPQKNSPGEKPGFTNMMQKQMIYFFPILTIMIVWRLPSAIGLYWLVSTLFSIIQHQLVFSRGQDTNPVSQKPTETEKRS